MYFLSIVSYSINYSLRLLIFFYKNFGFEIKKADRYIRVFDCSIREFQYLYGILSPSGAGLAGTTILQPAVYDKTM